MSNEPGALHSPAAILLIDPKDRIVYANHEASNLLLGGKPLVGRNFRQILAGCPGVMEHILIHHPEGLFSVQNDDQQETYHLSQRRIMLNRQRHQLVLLHRITAELNREEAKAWKKVIRVVCHELNNSLAPISSLLHSARTIAERSEKKPRLDEIFAILGERLSHLKAFIEGYAKFARLPRPHKQATDWVSLIPCLDEFLPVKIAGALPTRPGLFDRTQMQQLLVNLLKNAR